MNPVRSLLYRAASCYSIYSRRRKAQVVLDMMADIGASSVLFVGIGAGEEGRTNLFESLVAEGTDRSVGAGLGPDAPGFVDAYVQTDGLALPFADRSFDLVVSNAVIEHVGLEAEQARFLGEHLRVGRAAVVTTPNRWFPIEAHTGTLLVHTRRGWRDRDGYVTRLLSKGDLQRLLPSAAHVRGHHLSPTFTALITPSATKTIDQPQVLS